MNKFYDLILIGGGISSCVLAFSIIDKGFKGKIAIIENGRNLGGRSSSRKSLKNKGWILNHGSPNFNITNSENDSSINKFINYLLDRNLIITDKSNIIEIDQNLNILLNTKNSFYKGKIYSPVNSMCELSEKLIIENVNKKQIDLIFETLITDLKFYKNEWHLLSNKGKIFQARFIASSSNLIVHDRSKEIFKKNQIPLREAIPEGENKEIDMLINLLNKQKFLKRISYLIYPQKGYNFKTTYKSNNLHCLLNKEAEKLIGFERIIFQKQSFDNVGIVIHTKDLKSELKEQNVLTNKVLIEKFNQIFIDSNLVNRLFDYDDISVMRWRASQPLGIPIPKELQLCNELKIFFCGDWFDYIGFGRVEGAISSALYLSSNIINLL